MGKYIAICIGINHYDNLKPLRYAQRDAEAMRDFCRDKDHFDQIYFFAEGADPIPTSKGTAKSTPTYGAIRNFLYRRFLSHELDRGNDIWFFFAGHGKRHTGIDYLMLSDSNPLEVSATALSIQYVARQLRNSGASNVILMLDACRDVDDRGGVGVGQETQKGVVSFYACAPEESSYEIESLQQGAFTFSLLQGLRGGYATIKRLDEYLRIQVPALNQANGQPIQTPYTSIEPITKQNLVLLPQQATPTDAATLKVDAYRAQVAEDYILAEQLWTRVLEVLPADADAIAAIKRLGQMTTVVKLPNSETTELPVSPESKPKHIVTFDVVTITVEKTGFLRLRKLNVHMERHQVQGEYRQEYLGQGVTLDLMRIPAGGFMMGSPDGEEKKEEDESPQHRVYVPACWMGQYPVTQAQWRVVAALPKVEHDLAADPSRFKGDSRPVEQVSWYEAMEFCARLSKQTGREYRLPSEAEWEYACRAGTTTPFHFGQTITTDIANYNGNSTYENSPKGIYREQTTDVGDFKAANAFGLYDMHGNVWEWCLDHRHDNYQGAPIDGSAWTTGGDDDYRMLRGGSWYFNPGGCRSAYRLRYRSGLRYYFIGFRVVCASAWALL